MAVVYGAQDTRLERKVARKVTRVDTIGQSMLSQILRRFERETKALARMSHPNIVKIHDYGEHQGSPCLVMEFLSGGTMKDKTGTP